MNTNVMCTTSVGQMNDMTSAKQCDNDCNNQTLTHLGKQQLQA